MAQPDLASVPPRGELKPRERIDRHRVGFDAGHVAVGNVGAVLLEERTNAVTESGEVLVLDGAVDGERDRSRSGDPHHEVDRPARQN